jgi:hypothetical protein
MIHRMIIATLLFATVATEADAQNHKYRRRGVILGGLAGAAIGVAIGDKGNNETAGALIGAAAGAVAGGAIGNQKDQRIQHNQRYHSPYAPQTIDPQFGYPGTVYPGQRVVPHYNQPYFYGNSVPPPPSPSGSLRSGSSVLIAPEINSSSLAVPPVEPEDVVLMVEAGLSESIILQEIHNRGLSRPISVREIIQLHQSGVSERILNTMQSARTETMFGR